jgi:hypothetical protein
MHCAIGDSTNIAFFRCAYTAYRYHDYVMFRANYLQAVNIKVCYTKLNFVKYIS